MASGLPTHNPSPHIEKPCALATAAKEAARKITVNSIMGVARQRLCWMSNSCWNHVCQVSCVVIIELEKFVVRFAFLFERSKNNSWSRTRLDSIDFSSKRYFRPSSDVGEANVHLASYMWDVLEMMAISHHRALYFGPPFYSIQKFNRFPILFHTNMSVGLPICILLWLTLTPMSNLIRLSKIFCRTLCWGKRFCLIFALEIWSGWHVSTGHLSLGCIRSTITRKHLYAPWWWI